MVSVRGRAGPSSALWGLCWACCPVPVLSCLFVLLHPPSHLVLNPQATCLLPVALQMGRFGQLPFSEPGGLWGSWQVTVPNTWP